MISVWQAIMMHVYMCIIGLLEMNSIQVITLGTDSGGLGFSFSLP
jgi:hypothetical protein